MPTATVYRWPELPADHPMPLLERRRFAGERMTVARIVLKKGCQVPLHSHENEQISLIVSGRLRFGVGEGGSQEITVGSGEVLHLPPNVPHSAYAEEETVVLDLFSPPATSTGIDQGAESAVRA